MSRTLNVNYDVVKVDLYSQDHELSSDNICIGIALRQVCFVNHW